MSYSEKITHSDYVIDNSLSIQDLEESANKLLNYLTKNFKSQKILTLKFNISIFNNELYFCIILKEYFFFFKRIY